MGMGLPLDGLHRTVNTLEKTWQAWFEEKAPERRKQLERNFEYLLFEARTFLGYVDKEWRSTFKKPKKRPKYDEILQNKLVNRFVPSWQKKARRRRGT